MLRLVLRIWLLAIALFLVFNASVAATITSSCPVFFSNSHIALHPVKIGFGASLRLMLDASECSKSLAKQLRHKIVKAVELRDDQTVARVTVAKQRTSFRNRTEIKKSYNGAIPSFLTHCSSIGHA